jgi:hypothetical protein
MADGVPLPATGVSAATDDAGAAGHVQIVKLAISADGSATLLPADAANGLDVDVTRVQGTVTTSDANAATALASLLTELGQKLEPADLAALATAAKQDTAQTRFDLLATDARLELVRVLLAGTLAVDANTVATVTALPGASGNVTNAPGRLLGFALRETAGAAAVVRLRDVDGAGAILTTISLAPGESVRDWFGPGGLAVATRIYYEKVSGTIEGAVYSK